MTKYKIFYNKKMPVSVLKLTLYDIRETFIKDKEVSLNMRSLNSISDIVNDSSLNKYFDFVEAHNLFHEKLNFKLNQENNVKYDL